MIIPILEVGTLRPRRGLQHLWPSHDLNPGLQNPWSSFPSLEPCFNKYSFIQTTFSTASSVPEQGTHRKWDGGETDSDDWV